MNKRIKKKIETKDKLLSNIEYSLNNMDFKSEKERKRWIKFMTYKV